VRYSQPDKANAVKTDAKLLEPYFPLCAALRAAKLNMAFKKSQVVKALRIVFAELHVGWGLDADKQDRWVGAIKARVLAIIAAVKKAEGNPKPPKWVAQLPWRKGSLEGGAADDLEFGSGSDEEIVPGDKGGSLQRQLEALVAVPRQGQALVAVPDKSSFVFGWDSETLFGWRAPLTAPDDRELSLPVRVGKGAAPTDPITCEWRDGMVRPQIVGATYQIRPCEPNNPCWGIPEDMSWVEGSELIAVEDDCDSMALEDGDDNPVDLICLGAG
jgi:hypothetical protein